MKLLGTSLVAVLAVSCLPAQPGGTPGRAGEAHPSVVLISIDTLRADHLGVLGYRRIATPNLDAFADHGTVFERIDSQIPLTLPSHTSLFTSTYPFQNHVTENAQIVPANLVTLAAVFRQNSYKTAAFVGSALLGRRYGLDQGFDTYDSPFGAQRGEEISPYSVSVRRDGALVTRAALSWLASQQGQPVFVFVHLFDLHTPYEARQISGQRLLPNSAGYDTELAYVDQLLGRFREALVKGGWWQRAVVVVLSDHGESLGDHGETSHGYFAYESTLHVPLIVHWPEGAPAHAPRVADPGGLIDVAPTLLAFLHIPQPPSFAGADLLGTPQSPRQVWAQSDYAHDAFRWAPLRRLRVLNLAYVDAPHAELYDLETDPGEHNNLLQARARQARSLKDQTDELLARYSNHLPGAAVDSSVQATATLRSLGYLAGAPSAGSASTGPDPKERLAEYQAYENALVALNGKQAAQAVPRFLKILAGDPANTLARYYLGEAYLRSGRFQDAGFQWRTAVQRDPTYEPALVALGDLYLLQNLPVKAREAFAKAAVLSPSDPEALFKLGAAEHQLGNQVDARRHTEAGCKLPNVEDADCRHALAELDQAR